MKRNFDIVLAILLLIILSLPMLIISVLIKLSSQGPVLFWSKRVGKDNKLFRMPKFRTMRQDTPLVATHLLDDTINYRTVVGSFLRLSSLDEIPQLYSIIRGHMSFVGPRPALFNQKNLITLRTEKGVHKLVPGLTGLAQISGRDDLPIIEKVELDYQYLCNQTFWYDIKIFTLTAIKVVKREGVSH
jgi:O-antigen biosynthesis protein WbqP